MSLLLKRFLCCIPLRVGAQCIIWLTCLMSMLLVFTTVYLTMFVVKTETNSIVASNYSDISSGSYSYSNSSFYYEIGYGIDQILFFTKGTNHQRYVIQCGFTALFQVFSCMCALYAVDKEAPSFLVPWLVMFSHAAIVETSTSLTQAAILFSIDYNFHKITPNVMSAFHNGVILSYFVWVMLSFYKQEKKKRVRPVPIAPPLYVYGEAPPYNPTIPSVAFQEKEKAKV